jgi:hypothetical protein
MVVAKVISHRGDPNHRHKKSSNAKGGWDQRHNNVWDEYVAMAESGGIRVEREPVGLFGGKDERRPDFIFRECPLFENRNVIFDVSVRDGPVASNDCIPGEAARARELDKIGKYEQDAAARGLKFVALVFETCGFVAEPAVKLIKMLAERIAEKTNCPYSVVVNYWYIHISTSLQKGNAKIIKIIDDQLKSGRTVVLSDDDQQIHYENHKVVFSYKMAYD